MSNKLSVFVWLNYLSRSFFYSHHNKKELTQGQPHAMYHLDHIQGPVLSYKAEYCLSINS